MKIESKPKKKGRGEENGIKAKKMRKRMNERTKERKITETIIRLKMYENSIKYAENKR